ncbi:hypothetical protein BGX20_007211, partial [Mortierella sp. AD010]
TSSAVCIDSDGDVADHDRNDRNSKDDDNSSFKTSPAKKRKQSKDFEENRRESLQDRFSSLGKKWTLKSGTVVENKLFIAGMKMKELHPIHSFMIDIHDITTKNIFSEEDWKEITGSLPCVPPFSKKASDYLETFDNISTVEDLQRLLEKRPGDVESQLIHECLQN